MKITYYGHSAFQLETGDARVLFDPFFTGNKHAEGVVSPADVNPTHILLTHAHGDHWGDTPDIAKRTSAQLVANFEITQYASTRHGIENIQPMNTGGWWTFDWGKVQQTIAWHSSSFPDGTYGGNPNGYIVHAEEKCIYNLGDTALFSEMEWIGEAHTIDIAFMPIGDCFTMGPKDSIKAARMLNPGLIIPVHYDTFPYIEVDVQRWGADMEDAGFSTRILSPGETIDL
jgi:L-ascorbate metabolism protein UlaG (beta-lactamase superfamily)